MNDLNVGMAVRFARAHLAAVAAALDTAPEQLEAARAALECARRELAAAKACAQCARAMTQDVRSYIENEHAQAVAEAEMILKGVR